MSFKLKIALDAMGGDHGVNAVIPGADLALKVRQKASQSCGRVVSIHLDEVQNIVDAKRIIKSIEALPLDTKKTIMLFASPQALVDKVYWKEFVNVLINKTILRFIVVDEIQLFVHYGLSFRSQFVMLSTTIFKQIKTGRYATKSGVIYDSYMQFRNV